MDDDEGREYFRRRLAEGERKRQAIISEVRRTAGVNDDVEWITARELYRAGLISASELHATRSSELLPRGWYYHYVEAIGEYCPTRVWGLEDPRCANDSELASLYANGQRWMTVFSDRTGPHGDSTFIHVQTFAAECMTEQPLEEDQALKQLGHMGYGLDALPPGICLSATTTAPVAQLPAQGWYPDPAGRFQMRWWNGHMWTGLVATAGVTFQE